MFRRRMSPAALARKTGIPRSTLNDWITGRLPSARNMEHVQKLSEVLSIPVQELIFDQKEPKLVSNIKDKKPKKLYVYDLEGSLLRIKVDKKVVLIHIRDGYWKACFVLDRKTSIFQGFSTKEEAKDYKVRELRFRMERLKQVYCKVTK